MTALPSFMPDAEILREHLQQEARVLLEAPRINLGAFVRNLFESQLVESVGFKTADDLYRYAKHLIEQRAGRKLNDGEITKLGIATATEFNLRRALDKITLNCACCGRDWRDRLDERRYYVVYDEAHTHVCAECCGDTRGIIAQSVREQLREEGLGVEDLR